MPVSFQQFLRGAQVALWAGAILVVGATLLYLATLDNGFQPEELIGGDLITHQYAQVQARPSNAPGYPLYTLGGWFWFHSLHTLFQLFGQPLPNPIPILSGYSTLWALLALWLFYRILCHITRSVEWPEGNWPLAWLLSAFYAVTYFFWYYATTTEQYSSAVAQTLAIVYVYLLWQERRNTGYGIRDTEWTTLRTRYLFMLAFLCGLSLAHMLTVALIVPPLVAVILWQAPGLLRAGRTLAGVIGIAALPLLSYVYVYVRGAAHPEWWGEGTWPSAQAWFWDFVSTAQGREELGWGFETGRAFFGNGFPELIWHELSLPLLVIGLVGLAFLKRPLAVLLYSTLTLYLLFCWAYRYGNWFQVILPAYPLVLMGVGAAMRNTECGMRNIRHPAFRIPYSVLICSTYLLFVVAILWRINASLPAANSHNRPTDSALERAAILLAEPLPERANLFAELNDGLALHYLIDIWQVRPDLHLVSSPVAAEVLAQGKSVFATWQATPLLQAELPTKLALSMQSAGPEWIVFLTREPAENSTPGTILEQRLTPEISLVGYDIRPTPVLTPVQKAPIVGMDVTLFWRILGDDWPQGVAISVRPTLGGAFIPNPAEPAGGIVQVDHPRPVHGLFVRGDLPRNAPIADAYRLPLPAPLPVGADGIQVVLYRKRASGFENLAELSLPIP